MLKINFYGAKSTKKLIFWMKKIKNCYYFKIIKIHFYNFRGQLSTYVCRLAFGTSDKLDDPALEITLFAKLGLKEANLLAKNGGQGGFPCARKPKVFSINLI
jgi:hypothetical protein